MPHGFHETRMNTLVVTGTRHGTTPEQDRSFVELIRKWRPKMFRHGACKGADEQAVETVFAVCPECQIVAHPGRSARGGDNEWLSNLALAASSKVMPTKTHFERNRDMVWEMTDPDDVLVAFPGVRPLPASGGTAYTVEYARKKKKRVVFIWPDGEVAEDAK